MRIFVDTNLLLDVLAKREPFYTAAARVWTLAETGACEALVSAISFNNVFYIVRNVTVAFFPLAQAALLTPAGKTPGTARMPNGISHRLQAGRGTRPVRNVLMPSTVRAIRQCVDNVWGGFANPVLL